MSLQETTLSIEIPRRSALGIAYACALEAAEVMYMGFFIVTFAQHILPNLMFTGYGLAQVLASLMLAAGAALYAFSVGDSSTVFGLRVGLLESQSPHARIVVLSSSID